MSQWHIRLKDFVDAVLETSRGCRGRWNDWGIPGAWLSDGKQGSTQGRYARCENSNSSDFWPYGTFPGLRMQASVAVATNAMSMRTYLVRLPRPNGTVYTAVC